MAFKLVIMRLSEVFVLGPLRCFFFLLKSFVCVCVCVFYLIKGIIEIGNSPSFNKSCLATSNDGHK